MPFDPLVAIAAPMFVFGVVAHECAHAWAALVAGDPTARDRGRLTLNPLPHVDALGTIVVPGILLAAHAPALFGWGRTVPVEAANLRDLRNGRARVALAGPLANIALAVGFAALARLAGFAAAPAPVATAARVGVVVNCALALFHLLPIPPLDGSWLLMRFLRLRHILLLHHVRWAAILVVAALALSPYTSAAVLGAPVRVAQGVLGLFGVPGGGHAMKRGRILSGMRPTGRLHLGNFVGALENWVRLQNEGWENFHMVADWHMLTTGYEDTSRLQSDIFDMVVDWLSAGLDPERSVVFVQSEVKEHAELHLLLSMLVSKARLERIPTLKEQIRDLNLDEQTISYGHLGYSVLQAADILLYRATHVPVGEDQVPHIELTREIARRFNFVYCQDKEPVFPEPEAQLTSFARLRGVDGGRMSKSVGNTILLTDEPETIAARVRQAYTDPKKIRANDPGRPEADPSDGHEGCVVWEYHRKFNPGEADDIAARCRAGQLACVPDKKHLAQVLTDALAPIRERRQRWLADPDSVRDVIADGNRRARAVAEETMDRVRRAMGLARDPVARNA